MKKEKKTQEKRPLWKQPLLWWAAGWCALCVLAVFIVYYWRVFYYFDRFSPMLLTALTALVFTVLYAAVGLTLHFVKSLAGRAALLLAAAGLLTVFVSPPMQVPDEKDHYLRSYAISMGRFDFDAERGYPADVDLFVSSFYGAYTNANNGAPIKQYYHLADEKDPNGAKIADGAVRSVADQFTVWRSGLAVLEAGGDTGAEKVTEPLVVMLIPYLPQALGMAAARLCGANALGCLYAGRVCNLLVYVLLAYFALKGLSRWRGIFLAVLFLPLSLYMAASLSYDAQLLGLYALAASLLLREEFGKKERNLYLAAVVAMNIAKPWINLLWLPGLLFVGKKEQRKKLRPWIGIAVGAAGCIGVTALFTWYGRTFRFNYGEVGRMLGDTVNGVEQLKFTVGNPLRSAAVLWGTLFENDFFLPGLGNFGSLDTMIPAVAWLSVLLLGCGTVSAMHHRPLHGWTNAGIGLFCGLYTLGVMMAMYITYTPVGMVRVIGLQARYFLPAVLLGLVLLAQLAGWLQRRSGITLQAVSPEVKAAQTKPVHPVLLIGFIAAVLGALLLFQTYFIGPVTWVLGELPV
ncbi:MAG: DUF2142 domain-containing protein [Oscillospiraceae bacterium]|nr:DUF2142 domain-containing protein [Oscillospiraceae bacterium]